MDDVRSHALSLPPNDRAALARDLLLSLEGGDFENDAAEAWVEEVERRAEAYACGETTASDWRVSVQRVRRALSERREA